jgi:hypothetical protein
VSCWTSLPSAFGSGDPFLAGFWGCLGEQDKDDLLAVRGPGDVTGPVEAASRQRDLRQAGAVRVDGKD